MSGYSGYQFAPYGQAPPAQAYGQQQQQPYGQQPQYPQQQQSYGYAQQQPPPPMAANLQHGSAPRRGSLQRSMSFDPSVSMSASKSMALVAFDPYASTTAPPPTAGPAFGGPSYNNYSMSHSVTSAAPPIYGNEEMTTSPLHASNFNPHMSAPPAQHYAPLVQQPFNPTASTMSGVNSFAMVPAAPVQHVTTSEGELALTETGDFSETSADPELVAEQERIWQEIQDRRKMERIRADHGLVPQNPRAMVPYGGGPTRGTPVRTRSMPSSNNASRSSLNSVAKGGVAVLDPKKDKRKATRKMKTAGGAVGGAVVGGLVLGPVGVVLGAGGGAVISNKVAKSRDKRKQQEFEQKNFQKGASQSAAAKGEGAFA